jgi:predicted 3-demethylubiquinone-9 3-methyltransferase (glyoxalase superfamily)
VPTVLQKLIADAGRQKAKRTMEAMLKMVELDIAQLQPAHEGR